jgi:hypothetical protein
MKREQGVSPCFYPNARINPFVTSLFFSAESCFYPHRSRQRAHLCLQALHTARRTSALAISPKRGAIVGTRGSILRCIGRRLRTVGGMP